MLLHTNPQTKVLHIFQGVPATWKNVSFHQLRADGGLLVSAKMISGQTQFVRLISKSNGRHRFSVGEGAWRNPIQVDPATTNVTAISDGVWEVTLTAGHHVLLYPEDMIPDFTISAVASNASEHNWFGYRRE